LQQDTATKRRAKVFQGVFGDDDFVGWDVTGAVVAAEGIFDKKYETAVTTSVVQSKHRMKPKVKVQIFRYGVNLLSCYYYTWDQPDYYH